MLASPRCTLPRPLGGSKPLVLGKHPSLLSHMSQLPFLSLPRHTLSRWSFPDPSSCSSRQAFAMPLPCEKATSWNPGSGPSALTSRRHLLLAVSPAGWGPVALAPWLRSGLGRCPKPEPASSQILRRECPVLYSGRKECRCHEASINPRRTGFRGLPNG
nr:transmembrane inner ear expressed protein isoform X2 [Macaca fascicularis]